MHPDDVVQRALLSIRCPSANRAEHGVRLRASGVRNLEADGVVCSWELFFESCSVCFRAWSMFHGGGFGAVVNY